MSDATRFGGYCLKCGAKMEAFRSNGYIICPRCGYSKRDSTPESFKPEVCWD